MGRHPVDKYTYSQTTTCAAKSVLPVVGSFWEPGITDPYRYIEDLAGRALTA